MKSRVAFALSSSASRCSSVVGRTLPPALKAQTKALVPSDRLRTSRLQVLARRAATGESTSRAASPAEDYFASDTRPVILFDGVCNLCNGGVNTVLDWDKQGQFRLAALQSEAGRSLLQRCGRRADDISSIVLVEHERCYIKSEAVLRIGSKLGMPLPLLAGLALPVPKPLRDVMYDQVANNRYTLFGRTESCRTSEDGFAARFIS